MKRYSSPLRASTSSVHSWCSSHKTLVWFSSARCVRFHCCPATGTVLAIFNDSVGWWCPPMSQPNTEEGNAEIDLDISDLKLLQLLCDTPLWKNRSMTDSTTTRRPTHAACRPSAAASTPYTNTVSSNPQSSKTVRTIPATSTSHSGPQRTCTRVCVEVRVSASGAGCQTHAR